MGQTGIAELGGVSSPHEGLCLRYMVNRNRQMRVCLTCMMNRNRQTRGHVLDINI